MKKMPQLPNKAAEIAKKIAETNGLTDVTKKTPKDAAAPSTLKPKAK